MTSAEERQPPAGWYPDVEQPYTRRRYWDGAAWSDRFQDISGHHIRHPEDPPQSLATARAIAVAGIAIVAVIEAFNIFVDLNYIGLADRILDGQQPSSSEIDGAEDLVSAGGWSLLVGYLLIGPVTFLPWFASAYSNLPRLGVLPLRYKPGWAIGSWFIPFFNLVRPKQIANDTYRGSRPDAPSGRGFSSLPVSPLLHWWWALFLIQGFAGSVAGQMINDASERALVTPRGALEVLEDERLGFIVSASSSAIAIVAAILAIRMIMKITEMQADATEKAHAADRAAG